MKSNQDYKNAGLAALKGNWERAIIVAFIMMAVSAITNFMIWLTDFIFQKKDVLSQDNEWAYLILGVSIALCLLLFLVLCVLPLTVGCINSFSRMYSGLERNPLTYLKKEAFVSKIRTSSTMLLMSLIASVCSLALLVPGIMASLSLFLTPYLLKDNPELSIVGTLRLSRDMMKGHKMQLFKLQLSFLGWIFLNILTLGIGTLWLFPYMMTTMAAFYQDVRTEYLLKQQL